MNSQMYIYKGLSPGLAEDSFLYIIFVKSSLHLTGCKAETGYEIEKQNLQSLKIT